MDDAHDGQIVFNTKNGLPDKMECRGALQVKFCTSSMTLVSRVRESAGKARFNVDSAPSRPNSFSPH